MLIVLIALFIGMSAGIVVYSGLGFLRSFGLEKNFKDKYEGAKSSARKGISGNILFLAEKIGGRVRGLNAAKIERLAERIQADFTILGNPYNTMEPYTFIGLQILAGISAMALALLLLDVYNILILLVIGVLGFIVPLYILKDRIKAKHKAIFRQLPDVLDMLTLMVEAGLDFNASLNKILFLEKGALIDEFSIAQQEVKLGKSRAEAFESMAGRVRYIPLNTVINSITLAIKTGGSLAPTLRSLSDQFRVERAQLAEKMAGEAPIKLMAPLILLIFPTIFIILFGPVLLSFMQ